MPHNPISASASTSQQSPYELHIIVRHPTSTKRVPFSCREDIRKLEQLDTQSRFLALHGIDTAEQLMDYRSEIQNRLSDTPNLSPNEKKALRREVRLCDAIRERSKEVEANLQLLTQEQEIERKEQNRNEQSLDGACHNVGLPNTNGR